MDKKVIEEFLFQETHLKILNYLEQQILYCRNEVTCQLLFQKHRTTIYDHLNDLEEIGLISRQKTIQERGRPIVYWILNKYSYSQCKKLGLIALRDEQYQHRKVHISKETKKQTKSESVSMLSI